METIQSIKHQLFTELQREAEKSVLCHLYCNELEL